LKKRAAKPLWAGGAQRPVLRNVPKETGARSATELNYFSILNYSKNHPKVFVFYIFWQFCKVIERIVIFQALLQK